ncbi:MAG TPA: hypothetical protein VES79_06265 [Solirubrobacteraceae bacterium]|nr:hypothetical protein [Solirubrobacteraceae bacterium]
MSLGGTLRGLPPESRVVGGAAAALAFSLVLPWYQVSYFAQVGGRVRTAADSRSALEVFSWVEAAVLLVSLSVLYLVWARAQRRAFHLPGGDGIVVSVAGGWALALLVWRLFDKPGIADPGATIGIQWGIFGALLAAGALVGAGARVRAAGRPEPPNPVAEEPGWEVPVHRERAGRPRTEAVVTEVLRERPPAWQGEPPEPPGRAEPRPPPPPPEPPPSGRPTRRRADEPPPDRLF